MSDPKRALTGLDVLRELGFDLLKGKRIGVVANAATVDRNFRPILRLLAEALIDVRVLFGPEHGFFGVEQDLIGIASQTYGSIRLVACTAQLRSR